jgi:hypothetical protein
MDSNHQIWHTWAKYLHRWGLQDIAAAFLEAGKPVNFLAAQAVYISQPFLGTIFASDHLDQLAHMLEDDTETYAFASFLREACDREPERIGS